jgi:hypothetical protein
MKFNIGDRVVSRTDPNDPQFKGVITDIYKAHGEQEFIQIKYDIPDIFGRHYGGANSKVKSDRRDSYAYEFRHINNFIVSNYITMLKSLINTE